MVPARLVGASMFPASAPKPSWHAICSTVEGWTDLGFGTFELRYLRDKLKREVDFLVVRDRKPWFLVEVKTSDTRLSDSLGHFQKETKSKHAFQVSFELPYIQADCFTRTDPTVVPARTFLSQLIRFQSSPSVISLLSDRPDWLATRRSQLPTRPGARAAAAPPPRSRPP